jgi:hypothetical protein
MDKGLVGRPPNPSGVAQATNDHSQCRVYGLIRVLPHECLSRGYHGALRRLGGIGCFAHGMCHGDGHSRPPNWRNQPLVAE